MTRRLVLVRHGATDWNETRRLQGQADRTLSPQGVREIRALKAHLTGLDTARVFSSDLGRCTQTSLLLGFRTVESSPGWREIDAGAWTGEQVEPLRHRLEAWQRGEEAPPNGESRACFSKRIEEALTALLASTDDLIVLVTHGQVIREIVRLVTGIPLGGLALPDPASLSTLDPRAGALLAYNAAPAAVRSPWKTTASAGTA